MGIVGACSLVSRIPKVVLERLRIPLNENILDFDGDDASFLMLPLCAKDPGDGDGDGDSDRGLRRNGGFKMFFLFDDLFFFGSFVLMGDVAVESAGCFFLGESNGSQLALLLLGLEVVRCFLPRSV